MGSFVVKMPVGWYLPSLLLSICAITLPLKGLANESDSTINRSSPSIHNQAIEEGWVEKKIKPSAQWLENIFSPFTQWMEDEIQINIQQESEKNQQAASEHSLISAQQATDRVLKKYPGRVLRTQFKTGPPPYYQIKFLSDEGAILLYFINAFTGSFFLPDEVSSDTLEVRP